MKKSRKDLLKQLYTTELVQGEVSILYLGYSGVIVRSISQTFAFDVADLLSEEEIEALEGLDALLYTHSHYDHYNRRVAEKIFSKTGSYVVAEGTVASDLKGVIPEDKLLVAKPRETIEFREVKISPIEGLHKGPIVLYLVEGRDLSIFHGGDSAYVPLKDYSADLALVPTGAPSPTASPEDAYRMVLDVKAKHVAAFHGTNAQHKRLVELVKSSAPEVRVTPLEEGKLVKLKVKS